MRTELVVLAAALLCSGACALAEEAGAPTVVGDNLVVDGGFEEGGKGWSRLKTVDEPVFEGKKACVLDTSTGSKSAVIVQSFVPLKPRTYYRFSMAARLIG